jgi:hypothetical protein
VTTWDSGTLEGWTAQGNWEINDYSPWSGDHHAHFSFSPSVTNYDYSLISPVMDLSDCSIMDMSFDFAFSDYDGTGDNHFRVECTTDGVSWQSVSSFDGWDQSEGDHPAAAETSWLDPCTGSSTVQVRFRVYGSDSWGFNHWAVDDVDVHLP